MKQTSSGSTNYNYFLVIFSGIGLTLEKFGLTITFSSFDPSPSIATGDKKQFQCLYMVLNNKTEPLFSGFNCCEDRIFSDQHKLIHLHVYASQLTCSW